MRRAEFVGAVQAISAAGVMCVAAPWVFAEGASHPIVPSFERFHGEADAEPIDGGRLLLGELNCVSCHTADETSTAWIIPKPAPVLDAVASRVKPGYLRKFLADPQAIDPGTTMPQVFQGVAASQREEQVEALTHFLASGGTVAELRSDPAAAKRGERLFHTIGCAACHGERRDGAATLATSVPLGDLGAKYGIIGLAEFLQNPHTVRPGGRMPSLNLDEKQARDVAHFLIPDSNPKPTSPRVRYQVYEGSYGNLPDFASLTPVSEGQADGFDISVAGQENNFAVVFEGFLKIERDGEYWFRIGSDDGSRLLIDKALVANNDGVHAFVSVRGAKKLEAGVYPLRVEYAQTGGEQKLDVQIEGPGLPSQPLLNAVYLTAEATLPKAAPATDADADGPFRLDPKLAEKGRELFASMGCANCHVKMEGGERIASKKSAPALASLTAGKGCLAEAPANPAVDFQLSPKQRESIAAALASKPVEKPADAERVETALERFNCYACHARAGRGGVEAERNEVFTTTVPEMGDEGRIPPHLTGVGDKLKAEWMRQLLGNGANDRTYMRTRMPNFGSDNVGFLADAFAALDARTEVTVPTVDLPKHRVEAVGRQLVGESALSCIKCHNFGEFSGTGIQAINLQTMTRRLREDWFFRYMPDPQEYRPGTRMPSAFPNGKSVVRDILDGNAGLQLAAIWQYLELGPNAPVPAGTVHSAIVLTPTDRPIIYRNFLEGMSPRGIAVGYPEKANIAFDAEQMSLALIWHNAFIDAAKHWAGRGSGTQRPLGDHVLPLVRGAPLAVLADDATPWPSAPAKDQGWQFRGYRLDEKGRPHFRYGTSDLDVEDTPQPIPADVAGSLDAVVHRTIVVKSDGKALPTRLFFRAAAGQTIEKVGGKNYRIDDALTIRLSPHPDAAEPLVRDIEGRKELLIPVTGSGDSNRFEIDFEW
jgi:mono/diheme cytochrome c family protein